MIVFPAGRLDTEYSDWSNSLYRKPVLKLSKLFKPINKQYKTQHSCMKRQRIIQYFRGFGSLKTLHLQLYTLKGFILPVCTDRFIQITHFHVINQKTKPAHHLSVHISTIICIKITNDCKWSNISNNKWTAKCFAPLRCNAKAITTSMFARPKR